MNNYGKIKWQDDERLRAALCRVREGLKSQQYRATGEKLKNFKKIRKK